MAEGGIREFLGCLARDSDPRSRPMVWGLGFGVWGRDSGMRGSRGTHSSVSIGSHCVGEDNLIGRNDVDLQKPTNVITSRQTVGIYGRRVGN